MDPAEAIEAAALEKQQPMLEAMAAGEGEVQRFYKNCTVFVTGGSGFLGKQLLEKLLRSCQLKKIFILLRSKKGKCIRDRMQEIIKDPVFDNLHKNQPDFVKKLVAVEGDIAEIKLGIQDQDWNQIIEEIDVMFHVAATTRFDESLKTATLINVRGTREAIILGTACKKLRSYVHVSTAYSHATMSMVDKDVQEEFYRTPVPPDTMISMAETMEPDRLNHITKDLIKGWPNTYTFTKAIAEELVRTLSAGLPICIVRPAIVLVSYRDSSPGWLDKSCLYGVTGLILGAGVGVLHTSLMDVHKKMGLIPCDYVNNACIVAARETATSQAKGGDHTKIYTVCSTHRNPVTFKTIQGVMEHRGRLITTPKSVYYPFIINTKNTYLYAILSFFLHVIPAYMADFISVLLGKQRRFAKLINKFNSMFDVISFFSLNEWNFVDTNVEKLYSSLSKQDKTIFNFDITNIDWTEYVMILIVGLRKYMLKDGLKDTAYAIKKTKYQRIGHYVFMALYTYVIWKILYSIYFLANTAMVTIINSLNKC